MIPQRRASGVKTQTGREGCQCGVDFHCAQLCGQLEFSPTGDNWMPVWTMLSCPTWGLKELLYLSTNSCWTSLVAQTVKHLSTMWETRVWSPGQEDPLEKEMATDSGVLAWRIPETGEPGGLPSMQSHGVGHYWSNLAERDRAETEFSFGEGNGNPLQYSCLENPMGGGAW